MQSLLEQYVELLPRLQKSHKAFQGSPAIARRIWLLCLFWKHAIKHWESSWVAKRAQLSLSKIKPKNQTQYTVISPPQSFFLCMRKRSDSRCKTGQPSFPLSIFALCQVQRIAPSMGWGHRDLQAAENSIGSLGLRQKVFLIPSLNLQQHSNHGDLHECRTGCLWWHGTGQMILLHGWDPSGTASASHSSAGAHFMAQPQEQWNSCQAGFWSFHGTAAFLTC